MADLTGDLQQFVQLKEGVMPPIVTNVEVEVLNGAGDPVGAFQSTEGRFAIADMFPSGEPSSVRFRGRYMIGATWGSFAAEYTTIELKAPPAPTTADWEVVD